MATEPVWLLVNARLLGPKPVTGSLWVPMAIQPSSQSQRAVRLSRRVNHQVLLNLQENPFSQSPWAVKLYQVGGNSFLIVWTHVSVFFFLLCHVSLQFFPLTKCHHWRYHFFLVAFLHNLPKYQLWFPLNSGRNSPRDSITFSGSDME